LLIDAHVASPYMRLIFTCAPYFMQADRGWIF